MRESVSDFPCVKRYRHFKPTAEPPGIKPLNGNSTSRPRRQKRTISSLRRSGPTRRSDLRRCDRSVERPSVNSRRSHQSRLDDHVA